MKKVLFISLRSDLGGGPQHLFDLSNNLKNKNYVYIASPLSEPFGSLFKLNSIKHFELKHRHFSLISLFKLFKFIRNENIEIIHSHGRGAGIYSRLLKLFGCKVIHTFHGIHLESKIKLLLDRLLRPLTDRFILVSKAELEEAKRYKVIISEKSVVINNGLNFSHLDIHLNSINKNLIPSEENVFIVGALNRFSFQKGIDSLLKGIAYFIKQNPNPKIKFVIAGDGENFKDMEQLKRDLGIKNHVEFLGATDSPINFLNSLDLFISFSRWEAAIPYSVMEAMYLSCPVLLSNTTGHNELDMHQDTILFDPKKPEDFSRKLMNIYNNDPLRNLIKCDLKQIVINKFSADRTAQETLSLYEAL